MRPRQTVISIALGLVSAGVGLAQQPASNSLATTQPIEQTKIAETLMHGDSAARLDVLNGLPKSSPKGWLGLDDTLFPAVASCADDPSPKTRAGAADVIGVRWIQLTSSPAQTALSIEEKLARDPDVDVRHDAVAAGLRRIKNKPDDVVNALIDAAMKFAKYDNHVSGQVIFGLQGVEKQRLAIRLERFWSNTKIDPDRAARAYELFVGASGEQPPDVQRLDSAGIFQVVFDSKGGYSREEIDAELTRIVPVKVTREWYIGRYRGAINGSVVVKGVAGWRRVVAALNDSRKLTCMSDFSRVSLLLTPESLLDLRRYYAAATTQPTPVAQETYAPAFRALYDHLGQVYPNFQMKGIDWKAVGDELLPRLQQVRTEREFGLLIEELVARLQDSHASVLTGSSAPPEPDLPEWDPGITCMIDDRGRPVVYVIEAASPAEAAGVKVGMAVVSANGVPAAKAMESWMKATSRYFGSSSQRVLQYDAARGFLSQEKRGSLVKLSLEDPDGNPLSVNVAATCGERYLQRLPVVRSGIHDAADVSWTRISKDVGYIYVRRIENGLEGSLDAALHELGDIRGLIIDVRGNSGGGFDPETAVRNFELSPMDVAEPQRPRYRGPIALLIDERCISAGEGWSSWFVANHRAKLFGATTAGASSRKETYTLTNGLYQVVIPVKAYTGYLDRPIERRGLEPDVPVRTTARDLAQGRDTVAETALRWLGTVPPN